MTIRELLRHHGYDPDTITVNGKPVDDIEAPAGPRNPWVSAFPGGALSPQHAVAELLAAIGANHDEHTEDTPRRAAAMWAELLAGEGTDPREHLRVEFPADSRDPGLVVQHGIELVSVCAHHLLPFVGRATVAYRPSPAKQGKVVGLSKLARVVQGYSRRLQIQERIGAQVVNALMEELQPSGAACIITATHDCMRLRGIKDGSSRTTTRALAGLLLPDELSLIQESHLSER